MAPKRNRTAYQPPPFPGEQFTEIDGKKVRFIPANEAHFTEVQHQAKAKERWEAAQREGEANRLLLSALRDAKFYGAWTQQPRLDEKRNFVIPFDTNQTISARQLIAVITSDYSLLTITERDGKPDAKMTAQLRRHFGKEERAR